MSEREKFLETARPCKIGTVPAIVQLDGRSRLAVGKCVRVREAVGAKWTRVYVTDVQPDGYFMADR